MKTEEAKILIAEDNKEDFELIRKNLLLAGVHNEMLNFVNGQEVLDFLFDSDGQVKDEHDFQRYVLLLNLNLAKVEGLKVLEKIRDNMQLKKIPVVVLTATDDQDTIDRCYDLGCSTYIVKPTENSEFKGAIRKLGHFLSVIETTLIK